MGILSAPIVAVDVARGRAFEPEATARMRLANELGAKQEVTLWDGSRCDLVTDATAYEIDFAPKWQEAVGQSLYYGILLDRRPGIILLVKDRRSELRYLHRCQIVCAKYGIQLRMLRPAQP